MLLSSTHLHCAPVCIRSVICLKCDFNLIRVRSRGGIVAVLDVIVFRVVVMCVYEDWDIELWQISFRRCGV